MKKEVIKNPSRSPQSEGTSWVDVHNDALMVSLGIRPPYLPQKDKSVWTKTSYEKKILKSLRRGNSSRIHFHSIPMKSIPVRAKLIIQLKKNKVFPKSTYSIECWQHEIGNILQRYYYSNKKNGTNECLVLKYKYNGKEYQPSERPFWR